MGYLYTRDSMLILVADGMGGHARGEVASQLTLQTLASIYQRDAKPLLHRPGALPRGIGSRGAPRTAPLSRRAQPARGTAHDSGGLHRATGRRDLGARRRLAPVPDPRRPHPRTHDRPLTRTSPGSVRADPTGRREGPSGAQSDLQLHRRLRRADGRSQPTVRDAQRRHAAAVLGRAVGFAERPADRRGVHRQDGDARGARTDGTRARTERTRGRQLHRGRDDLGRHRVGRDGAADRGAGVDTADSRRHGRLDDPDAAPRRARPRTRNCRKIRSTTPSPRSRRRSSARPSSSASSRAPQRGLRGACGC